MNKIVKVFISFILLFCFACTGTEKDHAKIIFFIGDVKKNNTEVEIGGIIKENDIIITGLQSSCDIKIGGSFLRIKEKSNLKISKIMVKDKLENTTLGLDVGRLLCKTRKLLKSESLMIKTPTAVAGVRGTRFTVETDLKKTTRVKVYNGKVKAIKRITKLDDKVEELLEKAPSITEKQKVVVTEKEVKKAEKIVEKAFREGLEKAAAIDMAGIIEKVKDDVIISKKKVRKFKVEDFQKEKYEIIAVEEQPKEIIKKIEKIIKMEKKKPKPEGMLIITRYEIYFIKNGIKIWQGKIIKPPIKKEGKLYVASGDYVFCASVEGPVFWKNQINNDGNIKIKEDKLIVSSREGSKAFDLENGEERKL